MVPWVIVTRAKQVNPLWSQLLKEVPCGNVEHQSLPTLILGKLSWCPTRAHVLTGTTAPKAKPSAKSVILSFPYF